MALLKDQESSNSKEAADFVLMLLHAVTNTHILHWQTRSFSNHMALGEFYDSLQDLVDTYVESYQGKYGIINNYMVDYSPPLEPLKQMKSLRSCSNIQTYRCRL